MAELNTPFKNVAELVKGLRFEPIGEHPESPTLGDVIKYRDDTLAMVGTSAHVSYGPRAEMVEVARLFPREQKRRPGGKEPA